MISKTLSAAAAALVLASAGAGAANAGCLTGAVLAVSAATMSAITRSSGQPPAAPWVTTSR